MKIDLENHFGTQMWVDALYQNPGYPAVRGRGRRAPRLSRRGLLAALRRRAGEPTAGRGRGPHRGHGRRGHRRGGAFPHRAGRRGAPAQGRHRRRPRLQHQAGRGHRPAPHPLPGLRHAGRPGARGGGARSWSGASRSWASKAGTPTPTSATPIWTTSATGPSLAKRKSWGSPSTCTRPSRSSANSPSTGWRWPGRVSVSGSRRPS